jgi:hypothetical protein
MNIQLSDVGEILHQINKSEIPFRLENQVAIDYRWVVVGYEGSWGPDEMKLYRTEIDDGIQGPMQYFDKIPDSVKELGLTDEDFTIKNPNEQLKSLHLMQKDWLERGAEDDLVTTVYKLALAITKWYPDSDFTKWWVGHFQRPSVSEMV